jgi:hypothetical protein
VRRTRRLPIKGEVLVKTGARVAPDEVVARALLPGVLQTIKMSEKLGIEPADVPSILKMKAGDELERGQLIVEIKALFGLMKTRVVSDYTGVIESISPITGSVLVREPPTPVEIRAYVRGDVAEILPEEGIIVETRGAMVQGIFGVGGERLGTIRIAVATPSEALEASHIRDDDKGKIVVGGSGITGEALEKATKVGVKGLIAGGIRDGDLMTLLGYDIGVAITGQEAIDLSLVVTEGFGFLAMAQRTFDLLKSLEGQEASINGATQIRAGVIRPELIVPHLSDSKAHPQSADAFELKTGTPIRVIREPYFGLQGSVTDLPAQLEVLESGTHVRVLKAKLADGRVVTVPRANVEIIASS